LCKQPWLITVKVLPFSYTLKPIKACTSNDFRNTHAVANMTQWLAWP